MDPHGQVGTTPFHLAHQGGPDLDLMSSIAGVYDAAAPSLRYTSPHCHHKGEGVAESSREEELLGTPIRIGGGGKVYSCHARPPPYLFGGAVLMSCMNSGTGGGGGTR